VEETAVVMVVAVTAGAVMVVAMMVAVMTQPLGMREMLPLLPLPLLLTLKLLQMHRPPLMLKLLHRQ
jgi:NADH:ubiquinone oxidoreductase subunit 6 (subunit J)